VGTSKQSIKIIGKMQTLCLWLGEHTAPAAVTEVARSSTTTSQPFFSSACAHAQPQMLPPTMMTFMSDAVAYSAYLVAASGWGGDGGLPRPHQTVLSDRFRLYVD